MGGNRLSDTKYDRVELTQARCPDCGNEEGNYRLEPGGSGPKPPHDRAARCPDCRHASDPLAFSNAYKDARDVHPALLALCERHDLDEPGPGERWKFETTGEYDFEYVSKVLTSTGCRLHQNFQIEDGRQWEYTVPEPGWPEPLGYVTTDEPTWVSPQTGWRPTGRFAGNVRGTIPEPGDCDRHPELPADAFALSTVYIYPPGGNVKLGSKPPLDVPEEQWTVNLTYEQAGGSSRTKVWVYSSELGEWPHVTEWKGGTPRNTERRRVEFVETQEQAMEFVREETGLSVPRQA